MTLELDAEKGDDYGRLLAYAYTSDGAMFNEALLREGYAQVATFPPNARYLDHFEEAREAGRGIWGLPSSASCGLGQPRRRLLGMPATSEERRRAMERLDREDRAGDVEKGLRLIPDLGEVMPNDAGEEIRAVYEAVQTHLRVPLVNFLFRALANYPSYLSFAWNMLEPYLLTPYFEEAADGVRARSLVKPVPDATDVDWVSLGDLEQIRGFTDTIHYVLPKLLLVSSALDEGLLGGVSGATDGPPREAGAEPGVAEGTMSVPLVGPGEAKREVGEVFEEIRDRHGHPDAASYYRGIAQWPGFLEAAWGCVGPLVNTAAYKEIKRDVLEAARDAVLPGLPLPSKDEVVERGVVDEERIEEIRAVLAVFRFRLNADMLLDVSLIKALLDGPEAARSSRFSFAG